MSILNHPNPVPLQADDQGNVYVAGSRVMLDTIVNWFKQGQSAEEIARGFDTITRADVYGVLAYYLRHQAEVDAWLADRARDLEEQRRQLEAAQGPRLTALRAKMEALRNQKKAGHADPAD